MQDEYMQLYHASKPSYLEIDTSGTGLEADIFQVRDGINCGWDKVLNNTAFCPIAFISKSLSGTEWWNSIIEGEAIGILHGLEKFHSYCFARKKIWL